MEPEELAAAVYVPPPQRRGPARCEVTAATSFEMREVWAALERDGWQLVGMEKPLADGVGNVIARFEKP